MAEKIDSFPHSLGAFTSVTEGTEYIFPPYAQGKATFQGTMGTAGTTTATVDIEVSNDEAQWIVMGTITLSGASDTDGIAPTASWMFVRANCTALGSGADVTITMGAGA